MPLHEHRTIVLPLALVEHLLEVVDGEEEVEVDPVVVGALREAVDPDRTSTKWARISAALGLPDDRPTLEAVVDAVESRVSSLAIWQREREEDAGRADIIPAGPEDAGRKNPVADALRVKMLEAIGDAEWTRPDGRNPTLVDIITGMREIIGRQREALEQMPVYSTREAIKRAGLGDEHGMGIGAAEAIDVLAGRLRDAGGGTGPAGPVGSAAPSERPPTWDENANPRMTANRPSDVFVMMTVSRLRLSVAPPSR